LERSAKETHSPGEAPLSNGGLTGGRTLTIKLSDFATYDEVLDSVNDAAADLGINRVEFFIKDGNVVHMSIDITCPYCKLTFDNRVLLMQHIDSRLLRGNCMSS
jgi:hypothetical protein